MNILGPDYLVFGVDDLAGCRQFLIDYGLREQENGFFSALDGTGVLLRGRDDPSLPAALPSGSQLRETVYGVADSATLETIAETLRRDREVKLGADGVLRCVDDAGFALGFRVSQRQPLQREGEKINAPGDRAGRPVNQTGASADMAAEPRSLSHVVYFVPDAARAEAFYQRLGFVCTDRFTHVGPFLRPAGTQDHHTLFLIQAPPFMTGIEHFTFHLGGPTELMMAGSRFQQKGYQTFWGPGRHQLGSNWFWYFNSPLGCHIEYDADMDQHDDHWQPREALPGADNSQYFLLGYREKWAPGPDNAR
ncbi:VOC family protein [Klebsiella quasipneumoniae]|uniref:VOC family protein n=1 Tax=Klebsiella quasipneumoniae TaxID=1463165 RepID=UPI0029DE38DD|nr:VOC family protein [Klebsiella quasipneumoniae]MDX6813546.1 VOC family protein [Klebsiella quasipneumoniae]